MTAILKDLPLLRNLKCTLWSDHLGMEIPFLIPTYIVFIFKTDGLLLLLYILTYSKQKEVIS